MPATLHKPLLLVAFLLVLFAFSNFFSSDRGPVSAAPAPILSVSGEPDAVSASAYAIFALSDGTILASENTTAVLPIASVIKLATAARIVKNANLEETVSVPASDLLAEGRAGKLAV